MTRMFTFRKTLSGAEMALTALLFLLLFLALNGFDYKNIGGDLFRHGKIRWLALFLVPVVFGFLNKKLTWAPAFFGSLALFSWVTHDYLIYANFPLTLIFIVLGAACFIVDLSEDAWGRLLVVSGAFQSITAILQYFGIYYIFTPTKESEFFIPVGFMGHESVLGSLLVAAICPALWRKNYVAAALMAVAIVVSYSQMAWASFGAVLVLFLWHTVNFRAALGLVVAGLVAFAGVLFLLPNSPALSFHGRLFIWPFGIRAIAENPIFGGGIGSWAGSYIPLYKDEILKEFNYHLPYQLHCDYLDFIVEYGLAAFAVLGVALAQFIREFRPTWLHAVCAALLVNSLGNFPLCLPPTALIFVVCWARANRKRRLCLAA